MTITDHGVEADLPGEERLRSVKAIAQIKELLERAESAEAEVRRLTLERGTARRERNEAGDEAAVLRDTVRRLTEGLRALDEAIALHAREARQHAQERDSDGENWHLAVVDALRDVRDGMRGRGGA